MSEMAGQSGFLTAYSAFAFAAASVFYFAVQWFGKNHLAEGARGTLSRWLQGEYEGTWSHHFCNAFDAVFGSNHLSLKCFFRSALASVLSVLLLYVFFAEILGVIGHRAFGDLPLWKAIAFGAAINIIPDYVSLFETRWLLRRFERLTSVSGQLSVLLVDAILSGAIIWIGITAFQFASGEPPLSVIEMIAMFSVYSVFFYSTFLTSAWAWVYCLSTWIMRLFSRTTLIRVLDVKTKPEAQLALVGAVLVFASALVLMPVLKADEQSRASAFDKALCSVFGGTVCLHIVRFSEDESQVLESMVRLCEERTDESCGERVNRLLRGDQARAALLWKKSCDGGYARGCRALGWDYENGIGVAQDAARAVALYRQACDGGDVLGCNNLGWMYTNGNGVAQDAARAVALYQQACDGGAARGCTNLGWMYENGNGVAQDAARAVALYRQACDGGFDRGCASLGFMYENGNGVAQDTDKAIALYRQACDGVEVFGCHHLGTMYESGSGVAQDAVRAVALYQQACDGGDARGCVNLGLMYDYGKGVAQDAAKAAALYRQACDGGRALGCNNLGSMHESGSGVAQDTDRAVALYRQACDGGAALGCSNLGKMYEYGSGVAQDAAKAAALYRQACALGHLPACKA